MNGLYSTSLCLLGTMRINAQATPSNDTDDSCCIKYVELVQPIIRVRIISLVTNSLRSRHTYRRPHRINFRKPGACKPWPACAWFKIYINSPLQPVGTFIKIYLNTRSNQTFENKYLVQIKTIVHLHAKCQMLGKKYMTELLFKEV